MHARKLEHKNLQILGYYFLGQSYVFKAHQSKEKNLWSNEKGDKYTNKAKKEKKTWTVFE